MAANPRQHRLAGTALLPLLLAIACSAQGQARTEPVKLDAATIFLRGAELHHSTHVQLPAGESELVLSNVANQIDERTLSLTADAGVTVLSTGLRSDHVSERPVSAAARALQNELDARRNEREQLQIHSSVITEQLQVLQANRQLSADGRLSADDVERMLDLVSRRMPDALTRQSQLKLEMARLDEVIGKLQRQLDEARNQDMQPSSQIIVKVHADKATSSQLELSYVTGEAGWVPHYDLAIGKVGAPVTIAYKANVFQNSGMDWNDVKLTLSTGNPSRSVQAPRLNPWYVQLNRPQPAQESMVMAEMAADMPSAKRAAPMMAPSAAPSGGMANFVTTDAAGINARFDISIPYSIPGDGQGHTILVQNAEVPAKYQYIATPKLDSDAFLQANLNEWKDLNLLPGTTSVYFENAFVGHGRLELSDLKDGLTLSLGRDKRLVVERVQDQNHRGNAGLFGNSRQRRYAYTLNIHNMRDDALQLIIKEQLPVSLDAQVTLQDLKLAGARHNTDTGEITWTVDLEPAEQRSINYSFAVQYPKDIEVLGL